MNTTPKGPTMATLDDKIEYPDDEMAALARDYVTWFDAYADQLDAEGVTDDDEYLSRMYATLPPRYLDLVRYEGTYTATVQRLAAMEAAGSLIRLDDGRYVTPRGVYPAVAIAGEIHARMRGTR